MPNEESDWPEGWSQFRKARDFALKNFESLPEHFGSDLSRMAELSFADLAISLNPRIKTEIPTSNRVFHIVPEDIAGRLSGAAHDNWDAYMIAREICERNTYNGAPLPPSLRAFAAQLISGRFPIPKRRGAKPSQDFGQRWVLWETANFLVDAFEITLTRNDASHNTSACDAVVEAAQAVGFELKYTTLRDWCTHKDYDGFRVRAQALSDLVKDEFLRQAGILRRNGRSGLFDFRPV
ncbi:hypothetical protein [Aestuariivita boseongensis]|uniref:hypothetical protein n=1 Tax=Aestuariivita boseongensis TaxID=1470562 RepID=UPI0006832AD7|nr:hypothetical protein [Aestuariivita boseongensis]